MPSQPEFEQVSRVLQSSPDKCDSVKLLNWYNCSCMNLVHKTAQIEHAKSKTIKLMTYLLQLIYVLLPRGLLTTSRCAAGIKHLGLVALKFSCSLKHSKHNPIIDSLPVGARASMACQTNLNYIKQLFS